MKTKRDAVAWIYCIIWLITNLIIFIITRDPGDICMSTYSFIIIMLVIIYFDRTNTSFNKWLNSKI